MTRALGLLTFMFVAVVVSLGATDAPALSSIADGGPLVVDAGPAPLWHPSPDAEGGRCEACHTEDGWLPARFAHERTGFELKGRHQQADCAACHAGRFERTLPTSCAGCHRDPHQQVLGQQCVGCHREETWRTTMDVSAHMMTGFPLVGRHGALMCEECHLDRQARGFRRPKTTCATCHQDDFVRASALSIDHVQSRFALTCRNCHQPMRFVPALFEDHERCFPITRGQHRGVSCRECHQSTAGLVANGSCQTRNATCTACHAHTEPITDAQHQAIDGYLFTAARCVGCHAPR
jgi:hypothetical protein